ncbi:type II secretion system protein [Pseudoalteromonas sp. SSDWG2]|uniref:type II secretion system protein n=1 Tax=Pseudoalteromonas sp. SSDWG2 TaxID=3139391 RepID=UPI003BA972B5
MNSRGFTLVELVITIIIIGVLAVTAAPAFFGANTEDAYSLRDRTIAMMRIVQLEAMHNINSVNCVKITSTLIAPPLGRDCANAISSDFDEYLVVDSASSGLTFITTDNNGAGFSSLSFDSYGRPDSDCSNVCEIQVANRAVCVNAEGLIYACR